MPDPPGQPSFDTSLLPTSSITGKSDQNAILKALRLQQVNIHTRLLSIEHDSRRALTLYADIVANGLNVPLFANARAGSWYVPPLPAHPTHEASFKSADGHYGQWASSPRRPNLHVLRAAIDHGALVIVDVTRAGKRIPDSLSKTLPIWCAVINALIGNAQGDAACACAAAALDMQMGDAPPVCGECLSHNLFLHPSIPPSERAQIAARLPHFVDAWHDAYMHVHPHVLRARRYGLKPLRPLWVQPSRPVWDSGVPLDTLQFTPVICLSASDAVPAGHRALVEAAVPLHVCGVTFPSRPTFPYVQGAGDDEEGWAQSLTPALFWRCRDEVLPPDASARDQPDATLHRVLQVVNAAGADHSLVHPLPVWLSRVSVAQVPPSALSAFIDGLRDTFAAVIVLGASAPPGRPSNGADTFAGDGDDDGDALPDDALPDDLKDDAVDPQPFVHFEPLVDRRGKLEYKYAFGRALGTCLSILRRCCIDEGQQALICCTSKAGDWSAGLTIAWLLWHCMHDPDEQQRQLRIRYADPNDCDTPMYQVSLDRRKEISHIEKKKVNATMMHFLSTFPRYQISRATLKQINRFFSSPSPSSIIPDDHVNST